MMQCMKLLLKAADTAACKAACTLRIARHTYIPTTSVPPDIWCEVSKPCHHARIIGDGLAMEKVQRPLL